MLSLGTYADLHLYMTYAMRRYKRISKRYFYDNFFFDVFLIFFLNI